jgi:hypothetical protein
MSIDELRAVLLAIAAMADEAAERIEAMQKAASLREKAETHRRLHDKAMSDEELMCLWRIQQEYEKQCSVALDELNRPKD